MTNSLAPAGSGNVPASILRSGPDVIGRLSNMADLLHRTMDGRIGVNTRLGKDLWSAMVDPDQIELAALNLVVKARCYAGWRRARSPNGECRG
jgi:hypothetical protein